jgi:hypothetical protein
VVLFCITVYKEKQQKFLAKMVCVVDEDLVRLKSIAETNGFTYEHKELHFVIFKKQSYAIS